MRSAAVGAQRQHMPMRRSTGIRRTAAGGFVGGARFTAVSFGLCGGDRPRAAAMGLCCIAIKRCQRGLAAVKALFRGCGAAARSGRRRAGTAPFSHDAHAARRSRRIARSPGPAARRGKPRRPNMSPLPIVMWRRCAGTAKSDAGHGNCADSPTGIGRLPTKPRTGVASRPRGACKRDCRSRPASLRAIRAGPICPLSRLPLH